MAFCLPKESAKKFLEAIRNGKIIPEKLFDMSSAERRAFFEEIVGKENAKEVNTQLEAKILLKDQKRGMVTWAKKLSGISETTRRDLLSAIERMENILEPKSEKAFLEDLVAKKLGADVTLEEAKNISTGIKEVIAKKNTISEDSPIRSSERMEYGTANVLFREYIDALKAKNTQNLPAKIKDFLLHPTEIATELAAVFKSLVASLDNSFFGIQSIKTLYANPIIWAKNFIKSWGDIAKELAGIDAMTPIKADITSRPNALNGKYEAGKYDLGIKYEEAFPSSLPERIPIFGRFFKAAETAFNGAALRIRADLADKMIRMAERQGIDVLNPAEAVPIGKVVNSMSGRGGIGKLQIVGKELNVLLFSVRFFKSNLDFLTAHLFDPTMSSFARKQAAFNLAKVVGGISATLWTADQLWPGSVEWNSTSSKFGKICQPGTDICYNISGGMGSIVTLAARITPHKHNEEWGWWYKTSKGKFVQINSGKFGAPTALEIVENFFEGKASPLAGAIRDVAKGQNFNREKPTVTNVGLGLITPISIQTLQDLKKTDNESADILMAMILEGMGISPTVYSK